MYFVVFLGIQRVFYGILAVFWGILAYSGVFLRILGYSWVNGMEPKFISPYFNIHVVETIFEINRFKNYSWCPCPLILNSLLFCMAESDSELQTLLDELVPDCRIPDCLLSLNIAILGRKHNWSISCQLDLFDKVVKPILLYGCEVWGFGNSEILERVQLKFCKLLLHLKTTTPN